MAENFVACVTDELKGMWPDLYHCTLEAETPPVAGERRTRLEGDIEDMLRAWLNDHKNTQCSVGLMFCSNARGNC